MGLLAAYAVPHPPLIVPAVGGGQEAEVADTTAAYEEVARRIADHAPDLIVVVSPHAPLYRDGFFIADAETEEGSLAAFGQPEARITTRTDTAFTQAVADRLSRRSIPVAGAPAHHEEIDHATYVPLHFIGQTVDLSQVAVVRIGLSALSPSDHQFLGLSITRAAEDLGRRAVLIASGDLSHRLKEDGPYGFNEAGPAFDRAVTDLFAAGSLRGLFGLDPILCEDAAECGLRAFQIMAGALEGLPFTPELLSYEGPFGVGYAVAAFEVECSPSSTEEEVEAELMEADEAPVRGAHARGACSAVDPLVALARASVESIVGTGQVLPLPADLPDELTGQRAGVFVSLHEADGLRGCIGTIAPTRSCVAEEVIMNAVAAATDDPRFTPVTPDELDALSYSVDVLGEPEPVESLEQLDPRRYGVIVTRGFKRGLLLPDLEGVETAFDQIAIAKMKAGIAPDEDAQLERFEVVRHTLGGQARVY
ncbi:AmmeMemoRadiSam system protein A [Adlercreutzia sp. R7]|uniref:AmmeMemoRadiSam system protein A n=1 Tax=Adlercreutzia wanghongyangiae TaxID=3111451 RepID=A0ABU6IIQ0_9ACTN|nr:AmmeMemoRadiSam system protein A [Adlercreutzia sp. R7]